MFAKTSETILYRTWNSQSAPFYRIGLWLKHKASQHPGGTGSLILHLILFMVVAGGLPSLFKKDPISIRVITVDVMPIVSSITNIQTMPKPKEVKPISPVRKLKIKPAFQKPAGLPRNKPVIEEQIKPKEVENKEIEFDEVLKSVQKMKKEEPKPKPSTFNPEIPLSLSEVDAIIYQISKCWAIPSGAMDAADMSVLLHISLALDGSVTRVKIVDDTRYNQPSEGFFRASADAAVRAVHACSPLQGLPPKKYNSWHELELNFDPSEMFN